MSNAPKKILMASHRSSGAAWIRIKQAERDFYKNNHDIESYILESEADKIVRQTYETVVSAREVEKRRRDLFEQVALIHMKDIVGIKPVSNCFQEIITDTEWLLVAADKFAKGEK